MQVAGDQQEQKSRCCSTSCCAYPLLPSSLSAHAPQREGDSTEGDLSETEIIPYSPPGGRSLLSPPLAQKTSNSEGSSIKGCGGGGKGENLFLFFFRGKREKKWLLPFRSFSVFSVSTPHCGFTFCCVRKRRSEEKGGREIFLTFFPCFPFLVAGNSPIYRVRKKEQA